MSPANVMRENTNAPIGSSAISAQADAANNAARRAKPAMPADTSRLRHADENSERRAEREREAGIDHLKRIGAEQNRGGQRGDVDGRDR